MNHQPVGRIKILSFKAALSLQLHPLDNAIFQKNVITIKGNKVTAMK